MWSALSLLGLAAQVPLEPQHVVTSSMANRPDQNFSFTDGANVFSPRDLIELARPGAGLANAEGDMVLVPVTKYSFAAKKNNKSIFIAPLESTVAPLEIPLADGGDAFWLDSRTVGHVVVSEDQQALYAISIKFEAELTTPDPPALVGHLPTTDAGNFRYNPASGVLVFSAAVYPDRDLRTVKAQDKAYEERGNSAYVYDETFVRHWDTWKGPKENSLFSVSLEQETQSKWKLGEDFWSPLNNTQHHVPVEPFGGTDDFDVSATRIIYTTKDVSLPPAMHTKQNVYVVDTHGRQEPFELTSGEQGATHSPVFNAAGDKAAWLELAEDGAEADRARVVIYDFKTDVRYTLTQHWDRSPDSIRFSPSGAKEHVYMTVGDEARIKVFALPIPPTPSESSTDPKLEDRYTKPVALTTSGAASGLQPLSNGRLVFTASSLTSPNDVYILRGLANLDLHTLTRDESEHIASCAMELTQVTQFTDSALEGKSLDQGEDVRFEGAEGVEVQGWVLTPPGFKQGEKKKWPVVFLIHGGPQGAWEDQWSTRWNPNVFAQQGYVTVALNPTGSTTFGQAFTDAISGDWGGRPFVDMQKGWKYVLDKFPEIDPERAVAAGASWGGYAINWIQGHPEFGFGFKALVCHDGVFDSNYNGYSTDELFFFNHEWGGRPWDAKSKMLSEKFSPSNFVANWSTPQLLIHGSKDYRLPETESIGAFHALQQQGIPSRLVVFPDENHWVLDQGNSLKWHYEVFKWFDEFVGNGN